MAFGCRPFEREDSDELVALWEMCGLSVPWNDPRRDIDRKLTVQPELFLVGLHDGCIVSSVMGGYDGHRGWLYYLAVHPDFRGLGYGRSTLGEIEQRLQAMGCPKINLMVRSTNEEVKEFYLRLGYSVDEVTTLGKRLVND